MAGNELAHFHNAGFVHGECMPNNTYVTPDKTRLVFFDNDRIMVFKESERVHPAVSDQHIPLILCLFPALMTVIIGPAAIRIYYTIIGMLSP